MVFNTSRTSWNLQVACCCHPKLKDVLYVSLLLGLGFREHNTVFKLLKYMGIKVGENIIGTCSLH